MSPTLFDAQTEKTRHQTRELEQRLEELKAAGADRPKVTMPQREEKQPRSPKEYSAVLRGEHARGNALSAYCPLPAGIEFETQHEKEKILMVLRQHPVVNLRWLAVTAALLLGPLLISPIFPFFRFLPERFVFFLNLGWLMLVLAYVIESFLGWYYNLYIITDERLIDVDFYSLIYKSVSETKLDKIEDVTATTAGVLGAMFDYGSITIQTAAEQREFELGSVPHPAKVTKFLNELMLEEEREKAEGRVM